MITNISVKILNLSDFRNNLKSGIFVMCCCCEHLAHTRFATIDTGYNRFIAFIINMTIGVGQANTVILFLVGWCWSIGWGITMLTISRKLNINAHVLHCI